MKIEEWAKRLQIALNLSGKLYSPHPQQYYWRCWLGDEFTSLQKDTRASTLTGIIGYGVTQEEAVQDLVNKLVEAGALYLIPKGSYHQKVTVPADLTA